jgi:hypothetical protein
LPETLKFFEFLCLTRGKVCHAIVE